ncbi:hypothetical protein NHF45_08860 [Maricaulaceae bacterium NA33B04]|nr:hypothetical protein [Maricaulaceae bacterium NA33B04]
MVDVFTDPLSNSLGKVDAATDIQIILDPSKQQSITSGFVDVTNNEGGLVAEFRRNVGFRAEKAAVSITPASWQGISSGAVPSFQIESYEVVQNGDDIVVRVKLGASNGVLRRVMFFLVAQP